MTSRRIETTNYAETEKGGQAKPVVYSNADAVFSVDQNQRIMTWSQGAQELLGYEPTEVIGEPCYSVSKGCDVNGMRICRVSCQAQRQASLGQVPRARMMRLPTKWGGEVFAVMVHILLNGMRGERIVLHILNNVTEDTRVAKFLEELRSAFNPLTKPARRAMLSGLLLEGLPLTHREQETLLLMMQGNTAQEIADQMVVTPTTINNHIQSILGKLGCHTRLEAVSIAFRECLSHLFI